MLFLSVLVCTALLSYLLNRILIRFSVQLGQQASETDRQVRWASRSKPVVGGISFFVLFLLAIPGFLLSGYSSDDLGSFEPLLLAGTLGFLIGLADDAYNTNPRLKFLGQLLCGVVFLSYGVSIDLFGTPWLDWPLTLLWVAGIMNSVNMLDNMDGVTGSTALGILLVVLGVGVFTFTATVFDLFMLVCLAGALVGFLVLNWNPSKLYMGDTGSMFLGVVLAYFGVRFFWNHPHIHGEYGFWQQCLMAGLGFLMTLMDTLFVSVARLSRGQSPFKGGRDHITHHLVYVGLRQWQVPVVVFSVTITSGLLVLAALWAMESWTLFYTLLYVSYALVLMGVFYYLYRRGAGIEKARMAHQQAMMELVEQATTDNMVPKLAKEAVAQN